MGCFSVTKVNRYGGVSGAPRSQVSKGRKNAIVVAEFSNSAGSYVEMLRIVETLVKNGYFVEVFPTSGEHPELQGIAETTGLVTIHGQLVGLKSRARLLKPLAYLLESLHFAKWLSRHQSDSVPVVFSVTSPGRFLWRYPSRIRPIYIFHSEPVGTFHRFAGWWFRALLSPRARLLGVSEHTKNQVREVWGFQANDRRLGYLRNPGTANDEAPAKFLGERKQVLMVGRLHENKNPFFWLNVAKEVLQDTDRAVSFLWLGDGDLLEAARNYALELGIADYVEFPGFEKNPYPSYRNSHLYLHLAKVEPLGNAAVDALALGIPAVVSAVGGLREVVLDGVNGKIVNIDEARDAAAAVLEIIHDDRLHRMMSANARKLYDSRFSPHIWEKEFIRTVEGAISE